MRGGKLIDASAKLSESLGINFWGERRFAGTDPLGKMIGVRGSIDASGVALAAENGGDVA